MGSRTAMVPSSPLSGVEPVLEQVVVVADRGEGIATRSRSEVTA